MKILLFLVAVTLTELPNTNSFLVGYDCEDAEHIATLHMQDIIASCDNIKPIANRTIRANIYEIKVPKTIVGYRCQVRFKQTLVDWRGTRRPLPIGNVLVGRQACLNAHKSGYLDLELRIPHLDPHGTTNHSIRTIYSEVRLNQTHFVPGYHDQYYERDYEVTLSQHSGLVDFKQNIVRFDNRIYCDFNNFSCVDDHIGELSWVPDLQQNLSTSIFGGDITLITTNETLTNPVKRYAVIRVIFDLLSFEVFDNVTFSGRTVLRTKHPDLYIELNTNFKFGWDHYRAAKLCEYANLTNSYNSKYDSDVVHIVDRISNIEVTKGSCLKCNLERTPKCNSSYDPFERTGCMFTLPRVGMVAVTRMYAGVDIKQCFEKSVYIRQTNKCFNAIPVTDDEHKDRFLDPVSRIIVDQADSIVCEIDMTLKNDEPIKNSTRLGNPSKSEKPFLLPGWLLLLIVIFLCLWGLFGIIHLILLIVSTVKRHQHSGSAIQESNRWTCSTSMKSYLPSFMKCCPTWKQRIDVQEKAEDSVKFTS